jgi:hypothetical protein
MFCSRDGGVAAKHQEFTVRQIDDLHHPEDNRQPYRNKDKAGDAGDDFQCCY